MASIVKGIAEASKKPLTWANFTKFVKSDIEMLKHESIGYATLTALFYAYATRYHHLQVHSICPDPLKWTDAELGIPPDNED